MNKLHSFARIAISAIGLFFAFYLINHMITYGNALIYMALGGMAQSVGMIIGTVIGLLFLGLFLVVICYFFLYKREQLALKISKPVETADPHSEIDWLFAAFRLICFAAGIYCLHSVAWRIVHAMRGYIASRSASSSITPPNLSTELILGWLIMSAIGIYLLCGAPHFVRWHVKQTLEQCELVSAKVGDSKQS